LITKFPSVWEKISENRRGWIFLDSHCSNFGQNFFTFSGLTLMNEHCFLMQNQCIE